MSYFWISKTNINIISWMETNGCGYVKPSVLNAVAISLCGVFWRFDQHFHIRVRGGRKWQWNSQIVLTKIRLNCFGMATHDWLKSPCIFHFKIGYQSLLIVQITVQDNFLLRVCHVLMEWNMELLYRTDTECRVSWQSYTYITIHIINISIQQRIFLR